MKRDDYMKFNKMIQWLCKAFISGCIAFSILTFFCVFYYNMPVHYDNKTGATDYKWKPNTFTLV